MYLNSTMVFVKPGGYFAILATMKLTLSRPILFWSVASIAIALVMVVGTVAWYGTVGRARPTSQQLRIPAGAAGFLSKDNWYAASGSYSPQGPSAPLKKSWTIENDREVVAVTATDDMVFIFVKPDRLDAIDPDTGETSWTVQLSKEDLVSEIRVTSATVYTSSSNTSPSSDSVAEWPVRTRGIFPKGAVALTRGATTFVTSPAQPAPQFADDTTTTDSQPVEKYVFAFTRKGDAIWSLTALKRTLTIFQEKTGEVDWTHEFVPNTIGIWSPVVTAEDIYIWKYKDLVSIDSRTGQKNWTRTFKDGAPIMPAFTDNYAFIGSKNRLRVYDRQGHEAWSTRIRNSFPPIIGTDFLLVVTDNPTGNLTLNAFKGAGTTD